MGQFLSRHVRALRIDAAGETAAPPPAVADVVAALRPGEPLICMRPHVLAATAQRFVSAFPGRVLYAMKCNPEPAVLRALAAGGITHFDVASIAEVERVRRLFPAAMLAFMHPVKPRLAIRSAYHDHGVRDFALDSLEELAKILEETDGATDLGLHVRLRLPKGSALYDLSGKFGAWPDQAAGLLRQARRVAPRVGLCFHVGSQCMDPAAYERALELAGATLAMAGVRIDVLDVGGGFPVSYDGVTPPPLDDFFAAITRGFERLNLPPGTALWCEPGRALAAAGASLVVQVQLRRGDELFINDGIYGNLSDARFPEFRFPVRLVRPEGDSRAPLEDFVFYGPTCDSADRMAGPFTLPADVRDGDWIEVGQLGAYGACLRTAFNGFDHGRQVVVADRPLLETPGHPERGTLPVDFPVVLEGGLRSPQVAAKLRRRRSLRLLDPVPVLSADPVG